MENKKAYTKEQEQWLLENCNKFVYIKDIQVAFNKQFNECRTYNSIKGKTQHLKISKVENLHRYTEEQIEWMRENRPKHNSLKSFTNAYNKRFNENRNLWSLKDFCVKNKIGKLQYNSHTNNYTKEQDKWLKNNINNYSRKDLTNKFNELFNTNRSESSIKTRCNKGLKIYFRTNERRFKELMSDINQSSLGNEKISHNYIYVKVANNFKDTNNNWKLKRRLVCNAPKNKDVIVLDKNKPITKENTVIVTKGIALSMTKNNYNNLQPKLKKIAIKNCELKLAINKYKQ